MKLILVALDSSDVAPYVLSTAIHQAQSLGCQLLLLHSVGIPVEMPHEAYTTSPNDLVNILSATARKDLDALAAEIPPGMLAGTIIEVGVAWQTICTLAKERDVSMIIIGAHGHRWIDGLLGTTSSRVVSHSDRTVMVVRTPDMASH